MSDFFNTVDLIDRAMTANSLRYQVTANNLANAEVPNFKKSSVNFESQLARALAAEKQKSDFEMRATRPEHLHSEKSADWRTVQPKIVSDWTTTSKANGNNVNAEEEAINIAKIQMNYQLLSELQNFNFSQVRTAMK